MVVAQSCGFTVSFCLECGSWCYLSFRAFVVWVVGYLSCGFFVWKLEIEFSQSSRSTSSHRGKSLPATSYNLGDEQWAWTLCHVWWEDQHWPLSLNAQSDKAIKPIWNSESKSYNPYPLVSEASSRGMPPTHSATLPLQPAASRFLWKKGIWLSSELHVILLLSWVWRH
jgi:hypothetical protein